LDRAGHARIGGWEGRLDGYRLDAQVGVEELLLLGMETDAGGEELERGDEILCHTGHGIRKCDSKDALYFVDVRSRLAGMELILTEETDREQVLYEFWQHARLVALVARDSYLAATMGLEQDQSVPPRLREVEAAYLYERMKVAALAYAAAANSEAIAREAYEEFVDKEMHAP
jgi:hypothetical protein